MGSKQKCQQNLPKEGVERLARFYQAIHGINIFSYAWKLFFGFTWVS